MEGVFSFFLESSFLGLLIYGEKRLRRRAHWISSLLLLVGSCWAWRARTGSAPPDQNPHSVQPETAPIAAVRR